MVCNFCNIPTSKLQGMRQVKSSCRDTFVVRAPNPNLCTKAANFTTLSRVFTVQCLLYSAEESTWTQEREQTRGQRKFQIYEIQTTFMTQEMNTKLQSYMLKERSHLGDIVVDEEFVS
jgi:hypothetical protein